MRRELLELALPFPPASAGPTTTTGWAWRHLRSGDVAYVDRPLYDYVQHGGAALGHAAANAGAPSGLRAHAARCAARPVGLAPHVRATGAALLLRRLPPRGARNRRSSCAAGERSRAAKRRALRRVEPLGLLAAWLSHGSRRGGCGRSPGATRRSAPRAGLVRGIAWRRAVGAVSRPASGRSRGVRGERGVPALGADARLEASPTSRRRTLAAKTRRWTCRSTGEPGADQRADPDDRPAPPLRRLHRQVQPRPQARGGGRRVRIITVDPTPPLPPDWREQVESYSGLDGAIRQGRGRVRPRDGRARGQPRRPLRRHDLVDGPHRRGCGRARLRRGALPLPDPGVRAVHVRDGLAGRPLARQTYAFPHTALFSTELLREWFRATRLRRLRRGRGGRRSALGRVPERDHAGAAADGRGAGGAELAAAALLRPPRAPRVAQHVRARAARALAGGRGRRVRRRSGSSTASAAVIGPRASTSPAAPRSRSCRAAARTTTLGCCASTTSGWR